MNLPPSEPNLAGVMDISLLVSPEKLAVMSPLMSLAVTVTVASR